MFPIGFLLTLTCCCCCIGVTLAAYQTYPKFEISPDEVVIKEWTENERNLKNSIGSYMKELIPRLVDSDVELSDDCSASILEVLFGVRDLKLWAMQLLDATGKPPAGLLRLSFSALGSYDQCLDIKVDQNVQKPFVGQYCIFDFRPSMPKKPKYTWYRSVGPVFRNITTKTELGKELITSASGFYSASMKWAFCVPSTCTRKDVETLVGSVIKEFGMHGEVSMCDKADQPIELDHTMLTIIAVLGTFMTLVVIATVLDIGYALSGKQIGGDRKSAELSVGKRLILAFSMKTNWFKLIAPQADFDDKTLNFLSGVRFYSMLWVIVGHSYLFTDFGVGQNTANFFDKMIPVTGFQIIINAHMAVQTFFFIAGVLLSYNLVKAYDTKGPRIMNIPMIIIHRVWRVLPMAMLMVGIAIITPIIGQGPLWDDNVGYMARNCRKNWWQILLFINNYTKYDETCLIHTWYLSMDLQLLVLGMIFFVLYFRKPAIGHGFNILIVLLSIISTGVVTYIKGYLPMSLPVLADKIAQHEISINNHEGLNLSMSTYVIALSLGAFLARNPDITVPKFLQFIGWCFSIACNATILFVVVIWETDRRPTTVESVLYASLCRTGWAIGLSWLVLMCATGKGGIITDFLSWSGYTFFNRVSFLVYLIHIQVHLYLIGMMRSVLDFSNPIELWVMSGNLVISVVVASALKMLFESPVLELEKIVFSTQMKPPKLIDDMKHTNGDVENGTVVPVKASYTNEAMISDIKSENSRL